MYLAFWRAVITSLYRPDGASLAGAWGLVPAASMRQREGGAPIFLQTSTRSSGDSDFFGGLRAPDMNAVGGGDVGWALMFTLSFSSAEWVDIFVVGA